MPDRQPFIPDAIPDPFDDELELTPDLTVWRVKQRDVWTFDRGTRPRRWM